MGLFIADILVLFINLYIAVVILEVAVSWLVAFRVLDTSNPQASNLVALLKRLTDPALQPLRRYIPAIGGIDISPIVLILGLGILKGLIYRIFV